MRLRRHIAFAFGIAALSFAPANAGLRAHGLSLPQLIEIYVESDSIKVAVSSATATYREAQRLKRDYDSNNDQQLSAEEFAEMREALARRNTAYLVLKLDGKTLTLKQTSIELHAAAFTGNPEPVTLHIEYTLPFKLGTRPHKLVVSDKPRVPRAGFFVRVIPGAGVAINGAAAETVQRADDTVSFDLSRAKR